MHWIDWLITIVPMIPILWMAIHCRKYVRGVADYLAAGRVAGRYVIAVGDLTAGLGVITLVALCEQKYQVGYAISFWDYMVIPVGIVMGLTGYCTYRFRETRSLSFGQFIEMRYNRPLRVTAAVIRTTSEMLTNAIGPAIAANFFIYYIGLPHKIMIMGVNMPTFAILCAIVLATCLCILWPGGRIALLVTDAFQSIICYPIFVVIAGYIFFKFNWHDVIGPVMIDRVEGESFISPFDMHKLRDFNIFMLVTHLIASVLNRASWIGNDTSICGRTPQEQKMAGLLGQWRNGFSQLMCLLIAVMIISFMTHAKFADSAHKVRQHLSEKIAAELVEDPATRATLNAKIAALPVQRHEIGKDEPLSQKHNLDTIYFETAKSVLAPDDAAESEKAAGKYVFQKYRTLFNQLMLPVAFREIVPIGLVGLFCFMMIVLMLTTDDGRLFNASSTIIQDIVLPLVKRPLAPRQHLLVLRLGTVGVAIFYMLCCLFFVNIDYINMFITIMCSVWLGGAGPIMIFGLYSRFGTVTGAFCSLIFGSGLSIAGLFGQYNWAETIYPWLVRNGWDAPVNRFLETVSAPLNPLVVWHLGDGTKFPINSYEMYFLAMLAGILGYIGGSLLTHKKGGYNLDRLLHRGIYAVEGEKKLKEAWTFRNFLGKLAGITPEYTRGDKVIAWSVVGYAIIYKFGLCFLAVLIWNLISPWPKSWWSQYFYITNIWVMIIIGIVSTVWFLVGGIIDLRRLFRDLAARVDNPLDNGVVEGHVSLVDKATFEARTGKKQED
ncbi:Na+/panthothenate symporter [Opitutaceae bacterium TAV1]|nr:Na+/panthothenate symporter [Opitutaceae bacterium TAV1]